MERRCNNCNRNVPIDTNLPVDTIFCQYCGKKFSNNKVEEVRENIDLEKKEEKRLFYRNKKIYVCILIAIIIILIINTYFMYYTDSVGENDSSQQDIITVDISCFYDYYSSGDIKVDGAYYCGAVAANGYRLFTYEIDKSELSVQKDTYRITLTLEGGGVTASKTAYDVSSYVKFQVSDSLFDESLFITVEETK